MIDAVPISWSTIPELLLLLGDISVQLSESQLGLLNRRNPFLLLSEDFLLLSVNSSQPLGLAQQKTPFLLLLEIQRLYYGFD